MIYTRFGKWWGLFSLVDLQLLNFLTLVTEFEARSLLRWKHLNCLAPRRVPVDCYARSPLLVLTGSYRRWERIVVFLCLLDLVVVRTRILLAFSPRRSSEECVRTVDPRGRTDHKSCVSGRGNCRYHHWAVAVVLSAKLYRPISARFADLKWARPGYG